MPALFTSTSTWPWRSRICATSASTLSGSVRSVGHATAVPDPADSSAASWSIHVTPEDAIRALDQATTGPVAEGNVGGGTGMICYEFKCGTGTASRKLRAADGGHTVGVLVQANHGARYQLQVAGAPVGKTPAGQTHPWTKGRDLDNERGSIIIVVGTDAPLLPHQLKRLAKRAALGLARTGSRAGNGSGDIFVAFSTQPGRRQSSVRR